MGIRKYYKLAIDVIEEVRESESPATMPEGWFLMKGRLCCSCPLLPTIKCQYSQWLPTAKMVIIFTAFTIYAAGLLFVSLYTHPGSYANKLSKDPHQIASISIAYLVVLAYLLMFALTMFRLTMIFRKAYALMKISSNPIDFISKSKEKIEDSDDDNAPMDRRVRIVDAEF